MFLEGWQTFLREILDVPHLFKNGIQENINYCIFPYLNKKELAKIENIYEVIIPKMTPRHFRRYFRMYAETLKSIISYLALREHFTTLLDKGRVCRHKKVAMTCDLLGSNLGGVHHVMIMLFTFVNIFIKCHEINSQNKLIIITSLTLEHCHDCLEYRQIHFSNARM